MNVEVIVLPKELRTGQLHGRACAVFDVLRATTTMAAALAAGVREIRLFGELAAAREAADACDRSKLLCGEHQCLPPEGFDLGNSPGQFAQAHRGATLFMCTTNGTRALLAAREAAVVVTAALVNARAAARHLEATGLEITLLCAGTNGEMAMEDLLGAGAVIASLADPALTNDAARVAHKLFEGCRQDLVAVLRDTQGGRNVIAAHLDTDIEFAARLNAIDVVGVATGDPPTVRRVAD
jgi:2-phosphosulfolactate phosphatase